MPKLKTIIYKFTGMSRGLIFSQDEMAKAVGLSVEELIEGIRGGKYSYHAHPNSQSNNEYQFNMRSYESNIRRAGCYRQGGHFYSFLEYYDERRKKAVYECSICKHKRYDI